MVGLKPVRRFAPRKAAATVAQQQGAVLAVGDEPVRAAHVQHRHLPVAIRAMHHGPHSPRAEKSLDDVVRQTRSVGHAGCWSGAFT